MAAIREVLLTLRDAEKVIRSFEERYGVSTAEFLLNGAVRASIPEDDIFRWESYVTHRSELRRLHDEVHREYLGRLSQGADDHKKPSPTPEDQILLAA